MNLKIRQCEITDAKAIHDLNLRELGYDYSDDATKEKIVKLLDSSKDRIYVALFDWFQEQQELVHTNFITIADIVGIRNRSI